MGITVTTNLSLIKPDTDESIKIDLPDSGGWAAQNADNCDELDALFRKSTHTWTPAWTTDNVNPTLGSGGFVEGKYIRLFPSMFFGYVRLLTGGAGFAAGTGLYRFDLPITPHAGFLTLNTAVPVGKAYLHDVSAVASCTNMVVMYEPATGLLTFRKHDGNFWRENTPFTLAQNDRLSCYIMMPTVTV